MITDKQRKEIYDDAMKTVVTTQNLSAGIERAIALTADLNDDRATPPEPVTHPRTATMTLLDDGSHLLVIQNGDCIAAVTLTAAQVIAWEFREASK